MILFNSKTPDYFFYESGVENELFIQDSYAVLYRKSKIYFLQKLDSNYNISEIIDFLKKKFNLDSILYFENKKLKFNYRLNYSFIRPIKTNYFKYFLLYLFFLGITFYQVDFNNNVKKVDLESLKLETISLKEDKEFLFVSEKILEIYEKRLFYKIEIDSINVNQAVMHITLNCKSKDEIYSFFKELNSSKIGSITYDNFTKSFKSNATISLSRR